MKLVVAQWRRVKYEGAVCAGRRLLTLSVVLQDVAGGSSSSREPPADTTSPPACEYQIRLDIYPPIQLGVTFL